MSASAKGVRRVKLPRTGDVIRTVKHGDVTVEAVWGYGRYLLVTEADGHQLTLHRAGDETWLRVPEGAAREPSAIPEAAIQAAAEVRLRNYASEYDAPHLTWRDFAGEAREMLEAAMPFLAKTWGVSGA